VHATGVYFPDRSHALRVSLKKLRYVLELSDDWEGHRRGLKLLRRAQQALGEIHDRQMVLENLKRATRKAGENIPSADALIRVLEAECRTLYEKFLARRDDVLRLCEVVRQWATSHRLSRRRGTMLTMGMVALPSAAALILARQARRGA
jgi:hypothetical protein